ncbi:hypothetical protein F5884DRAFT_257583 [Xylogone sp. PMI_703]|nr:hypothetical protein F5884DRAFT_257583 [Xylogone sp. PMI_703]
MESFKWHETDEGKFERNCDGTELTTTAINELLPGTEELVVVRGGVTAQFSFDDAVDRFKRAWVALRYDHPAIAATSERGKKIYHVPTNVQLDEWLKRTMSVVQRDDAELEWKWAGETALYVVLKKSVALVGIQCSHDRIDGQGMVYLLDNLLHLVANPKAVTFGGEIANLTPSLRVAGDIFNTLPEQEAQAMKNMGEFVAGEPTIKLKTFPAKVPPGRTLRNVLCFSAPKSRSIAAVAKSLGFTVTHVFQAALVAAIAQFSGETGPYKAMFPVSIRKRLRAPFNDGKLFPVAVFMYTHGVTLPPAGFKATAENIKNVYASVSSMTDILEQTIAAGDVWANIISTNKPDLSTLHATTDISSLGILDGILNTTEIPGVMLSQPWVGIDLPGPPIPMHLWSWRGEICLGASYNEAFHTKDMVEAFLYRISSCLSDGLGLDLPLEPTII